MAISPVSPNVSSQVGSVPQSAPPPVSAEKENEAEKVTATAPTVNTSGQTTGTTINVTA